MATDPEHQNWGLLGFVIGERRKKWAKISQAEAAKKSGVSINTWGRLEAGQPVRLTNLWKMVAALGWPAQLTHTFLSAPEDQGEIVRNFFRDYNAGVKFEDVQPRLMDLYGVVYGDVSMRHPTPEEIIELTSANAAEKRGGPDGRSERIRQATRVPLAVQRTLGEHSQVIDAKYRAISDNLTEVTLLIKDGVEPLTADERVHVTQIWAEWAETGLVEWDTSKRRGIRIADPDDRFVVRREAPEREAERKRKEKEERKRRRNLPSGTSEKVVFEYVEESHMKAKDQESSE